MEGDNIFRYRNMDIKLGGRERATVVYSNYCIGGLFVLS